MSFFRIVKFNYYKIKSFIIKIHKQQLKIEDLIKENFEYELLITNMIDGGTKLYTDNYCKENAHILLLQNFSYKKDFFYTVTNLDNKQSTRMNLEELRKMIYNTHIKKITVNTLVTWKNGLKILNYLGEAYEQTKVEIRYMVHDYYCLCPNYNLFIDNSFCNFTYCDSTYCFQKLKTFFSYFTANCDNHKKWMGNWSKFFQCVSEIRCFSESSKNFLLSAYPEIPLNKITVVPHSMDYCSYFPILPVNNENAIIGIVGNINTPQKGCLIVRELLKYIKFNKKDTKVFVVGNLQKSCHIKSRNIEYLGSYTSGALGEILKSHRINTVLFPSICPETFSYLVSELIALDVPIVSFNIGAQADKVKNYSKGRIVELNSTSEEIYTKLIGNL